MLSSVTISIIIPYVELTPYNVHFCVKLCQICKENIHILYIITIIIIDTFLLSCINIWMKAILFSLCCCILMIHSNFCRWNLYYKFSWNSNWINHHLCVCSYYYTLSNFKIRCDVIAYLRQVTINVIKHACLGVLAVKHTIYREWHHV